MSTLRNELRDRLRPVIPAEYKLRPNGLALETITTPVLQIKQLRIRPAEEAGTGQLKVEMVLTMASPKSNPQAAEDDLDDDVVEVLAALDSIGWLNWSLAEKVTTGPDDRYLAYDITTEITTTIPEEADHA
ncbi:hypothetical protein [Agrococcus sp. TF02-05]|uniref:hypothetical protein n=1 Tax=Agrococcus sp. TF02-05 TaxID=2815211 RepID=UPI001AA0F92E|nr:hypothetical protein [Agrococcus sp. TF02-05]MBO1770458.1 hypothetical protein [Agrococcus sp. TF02-05]